MPIPSSLLAAMLGLSLATTATLAAADATEPPAVGASTRTLLAQQRSGSQAAPQLPMLGATSDLAYQRYLESFKGKIPERMTSELSKGSPAAR